MTREKFRPFTGDGKMRVSLKKNALALVVCQAAWPELSSLRNDEQLREAVGRLDAAFADYPLVSEGHEVAINVSLQGIEQTQGGTIFQWKSSDERWAVSLSRRAISFICLRDYSSFEEFSERSWPLFESVFDVLRVPRLERVGVRYVNRFDDPDSLSKLSAMFPALTQEVESYSASVELLASMRQLLFRVDDFNFQVRAGTLPALQTVDPMLPPLDHDSWVLDLDSFCAGNQVAEIGSFQDLAGRLADTNYDFFKLSLSDEFLTMFGEEE